MAVSSGTYAFQPSIAQATIQAFHMCGIRPTALLQEHMESARMAANFVFTDWGNKGVNLWKVATVTVPFVQGTASYAASPNLVEILDLFMSVPYGTDFSSGFNGSFGGSANTNRYLFPVSRTEFVSYPNPNTQSPPTVYWHNRTLTPTINFYPTPDGTQTSFTYYASQQIQDAAFTNGQVADIPYLWMNAFVKALAAELAIMWAPDKAMPLNAAATQAWTAAALTGTENSNLYISPQMSGYWR